MENKLMVLNIPWDVNTEGLREYINQFGPLNDCVVIKEHFGYVTFSSTEDTKKALESEHFLGNRTLTVMVATPKEEMRGPAKKATRIFVARIPPSVTETMFREYFKEYGEITDIYMPKVQPSKEHRGIGFITYESADSVNTIMAKSHELGGSTVGVDLATPKDDDARYPSRMVPGGYYAYNAYISGATRYAALGGFLEPPRGMSKRIIAGRLPQEANANDLRQYFGRFGPILYVHVPKGPENSCHQGFGLVAFAEDGVADLVLSRTHEILGHEVVIDSASPVNEVGSVSGGNMDLAEAYGGSHGPIQNYSGLYGSIDFYDYGYGPYCGSSMQGKGQGQGRGQQDWWY